MKTGDIKRIKILNGWGEEFPIDARYLGRGAFATCYEADGFVYSFVKANDAHNHTDYSKEALSEWASGLNVPEFEKMGIMEDGRALYKSPLYNPLTPKNKVAWNQFRILESAWKKTSYKKFGYEFNYTLIDSVRDVLPIELIESLESINSACSNYGDSYYFEFPRRNLKIDSNGNLILLDVIFNSHATKGYLTS